MWWRHFKDCGCSNCWRNSGSSRGNSSSGGGCSGDGTCRGYLLLFSAKATGMVTPSGSCGDGDYMNRTGLMAVVEIVAEIILYCDVVGKVAKK